MAETFNPQRSVLGLGVHTAAQLAVSHMVPAAIDSFVDADDISLVHSIGRADLSARMIGLPGNAAGARTSLPAGGPLAVPFALSPFVLKALGLHFGAVATPVLIAGDAAAWTQVLGADETDIDVSGRFATVYFDKTNGVPEYWHPVGFSQVVFNFPQAEEATVTFTPAALEARFYDLGSSEAGSPANVPLIRGWLNATNNALPNKDLHILVTAVTGVTPNVVVTCKAAFGATPAGATTFDVPAGLNLEGRPQWTEVVLDDGGIGGPPIGTADMKFQIAFPDDGDVTVADETSYANPATELTKVRPAQPSFTTSATCLTVDGTKVAGLVDVTVTSTSALTTSEGGTCRAAAGTHKLSGTNTVAIEATIDWIHERHDMNLHDDSEVALLVEARHDQIIDGAGASRTQFNFVMSIPLGRYADGSSFKALAGAADDTRSLSLTGHPDDSNPQLRITAQTDVETLFA